MQYLCMYGYMSECFAGVCSNYYFIITFFPLLRFVLCFYVLNAFVVIAAAVAAAAGAPQTFLSQQKFAYVCMYLLGCVYVCVRVFMARRTRTYMYMYMTVYVCVVRNQQGWRQTSCCVPPLHVTCCCCCWWCCCCIVVVVGGYVFAWFDHFSAAAVEQSSSVGSRRPCAYFWLTIATVCASASERERQVCANIAAVCDVDVAVLPISLSLSLLLPLSFPDALNYLIIVRFFFLLILAFVESWACVCMCVCMRACVRVCFCFRAALSTVSRVASSFSFAHTHSTHWFVWFLLLLLCVCFAVVVAFATWALCFGLWMNFSACLV